MTKDQELLLALRERNEARQQVDALTLINANLVQYREQAEQTTASYREQLREARAEVERLRAHIAGEPDRTAHSMQRWMDIVKEQQAALRTVAERQREACAEAVKRFWGVGDHNAEVQACRATPLVTEGEP